MLEMYHISCQTNVLNWKCMRCSDAKRTFMYQHFCGFCYFKHKAEIRKTTCILRLTQTNTMFIETSIFYASSTRTSNLIWKYGNKYFKIGHEQTLLDITCCNFFHVTGFVNCIKNLTTLQTKESLFTVTLIWIPDILYF